MPANAHPFSLISSPFPSPPLPRSSLLTQEGICLTLDPAFHFLEVRRRCVLCRVVLGAMHAIGNFTCLCLCASNAPAVFPAPSPATADVLPALLPMPAGGLPLRRPAAADGRGPRAAHPPVPGGQLLSCASHNAQCAVGWCPPAEQQTLLGLSKSRCSRSAPPAFSFPALPVRASSLQVLFQDGRFQWDRLENLLQLAKEGSGTGPGSTGGLDLSTTVSDGARVRSARSFAWPARLSLALLGAGQCVGETSAVGCAQGLGTLSICAAALL